MEEAVVNHVGQALFVVGDYRLEAVPPEHFVGQVRGTSLRCLPGGLSRALQQHDDLKLLVDYVRRAQVVERTVGVDLVHHYLRPDQEYVGVVVIHLHLFQITGALVVLFTDMTWSQVCGIKTVYVCNI